jgi:hypothetical protein
MTDGPLSPEELGEYLNEKLDSRDWWFLVNNLDLMKVVESRYYQGEKNQHFHIVMSGKYPGFTVAVARKAEMTPVQLAECCIEVGAEGDFLGKGLENNDILFPMYGDPIGVLMAQAVFSEMVGGDG